MSIVGGFVIAGLTIVLCLLLFAICFIAICIADAFDVPEKVDEYATRFAQEVKRRRWK